MVNLKIHWLTNKPVPFQKFRLEVKLQLNKVQLFKLLCVMKVAFTILKRLNFASKLNILQQTIELQIIYLLMLFIYLDLFHVKLVVI